MFSLRNFFPDNQLTELGGEYIDSEHTTMRGLVDELGLKLNDLGGENPGGEHTYFFNNERLRVDASFIDQFRPVAKAVAADLKLMKVRGEISYDTPHAREVDRLSIPEWFEKRGISGLPTAVLRAAYVGEYGLEIDQQSALNLLLTMGDKTPPDEFRIFGPSDERFHIVEGNDSVPARLAERLKQPVEFGTRLEAIRSDGSGFKLALRTDNATTEAKADMVVLALPFTILRQLDVRVKLPEAKRKAIQELGYGTNAKLIAGFSRRVWEESHSTGYTFTDLEFQCCWETSRGQPGTHAILTNFAGGNLGLHLNEGETAGSRRHVRIAGRADLSRRRRRLHEESHSPALAQLPVRARLLHLLQTRPILDPGRFRRDASRQFVFRRRTHQRRFQRLHGRRRRVRRARRERSAGKDRTPPLTRESAALRAALKSRPSLAAQRAAATERNSIRLHRRALAVFGASLRGFFFTQNGHAQIPNLGDRFP